MPGPKAIAPGITEGCLDLAPGSLGRLWREAKVDVVVGHPTFRNAANIGRQLVDGLRGALANFPGSRVAFVVSDGTWNHASEDRSCVDAALEAARRFMDGLDAVERDRLLVTATPYDGYMGDRTPGKGSALKLVFEEMAHCEARFLILLDGDLRNDMARWQEVFARVVAEHERLHPGRDFFITARYARHFVDASLTRFIVGPLTTLMGQHVPGGISGDIVLSAGAVAHERSAEWNEMRRRYGTDISTTFDNVADENTIIYEVYLGAKLHDITDEGKLSVMPGEVIGAALERLLHHERSSGRITDSIGDAGATLRPLERWDSETTGIDFIDPGYTDVFDVDVKMKTLAENFDGFRDDLRALLAPEDFAGLEGRWRELVELRERGAGPLRFLDEKGERWIDHLHRAVARVLVTGDVDTSKRALNYLYTAAFLEFCREKLAELGHESLAEVREAQRHLGVPAAEARRFYGERVDGVVDALAMRFFEKRRAIQDHMNAFRSHRA